MRGRMLAWAGGVVAAGACVGLGVYFAQVGLDRANQLAGVLGAFIGLAGLAVALYGTIESRRRDKPAHDGQRPADQPRASGDVRNEIRGGTITGTVIQARDIGPLHLGSPLPPPPPAPPVRGE